MSVISDALSAAEAALEAEFGDAGLLRGSEPVTVVISRGVELAGDYGQVSRRADTASFAAASTAKSGDSLSVGAERWVLDTPLASATGRVEFVLRVTP